MARLKSGTFFQIAVGRLFTEAIASSLHGLLAREPNAVDIALTKS